MEKKSQVYLSSCFIYYYASLAGNVLEFGFHRYLSRPFNNSSILFYFRDIEGIRERIEDM